MSGRGRGEKRTTEAAADRTAGGAGAIGKRTLTAQMLPGGGPATTRAATLLGPPAGGGTPAVQRAPASPAGAPPTADPPTPGINKPGFIDHGDGSNLRSGPAELGGQKLRDTPLPPATRVFVTGTHPRASEWWYVTASLPDHSMVRGYVQHFRVTTDLPEPTAKLHQIQSGDTAERLAVQEFSGAVRDGHDLRYYENVLLYVNRERGRAGITGTYQDPGLLGGGSNNIQLVAGHRIWLVSPAYARALESVVPSGSLTGGAVAKVQRFAGHVEDILESVTESPSHFGEIAGEYAEAIRQHLPEIIGIVAGFIMAEALSAFLAATPTGVGQIAAIVIQLGLAAFGAVGLVQAGIEALKHAEKWLTLAWSANGKQDQLALASKEFLKMLVSIAMAALAYLGVKGNLGKAVKIAGSLPPPSAMPALAVAGGGTLEVGAGAGAGVAIGGPGVAGPVAGGGMMMSGGSQGKTHSEHAKERGAQGRRTGPAFGDAQRARQADVYVQPDGRYVVRGPRGREHIFEPDGTHVTSIDRSAKAHQGKVNAGERTPITAEGFERFKEIFK